MRSPFDHLLQLFANNLGEDSRTIQIGHNKPMYEKYSGAKKEQINPNTRK